MSEFKLFRRGYDVEIKRFIDFVDDETEHWWLGGYLEYMLEKYKENNNHE